MIPRLANVAPYYRGTEDVPVQGGSSVEEILARVAVEVLVTLAALAIRQLVQRFAPGTANA